MERDRDNLMKEELMMILDPVVKNHFRPEFINRLDDILPFMPLHEKDMEKIVTIQLDLLAKRLHQRDVALSWTPEVLAHLEREGYEPAFGARPLKRYIQKEVINKLSKEILEGKIPPKSKIKLNLEKGEIVFKT